MHAIIKAGNRIRTAYAGTALSEGTASSGAALSGLVSADLVSAGLASSGLASSGLVSAGLVSAGLASSGLVSSGLVSAGLVSAGAASPDAMPSFNAMRLYTAAAAVIFADETAVNVNPKIPLIFFICTLPFPDCPDAGCRYTDSESAHCNDQSILSTPYKEKLLQSVYGPQQPFAFHIKGIRKSEIYQLSSKFLF